MAADMPAANWLSASAYAPLVRCDRHGFAWEWLRRWSAYRAAFERASVSRKSGLAWRFGLHRFEPPGLPWPLARPIWRRAVDDSVLRAAAVAAGRAGAFDLDSLNAAASCAIDADGEHWLLADHGRHVRIDLIDGSIGRGPVELQFHVSGYPCCRGQIAALERLIALAELGRWPARNPPPERRAARWALILRVHDALMAGASHREIAQHLFDLGDLPRWRVAAPSWRRRVQRLAEVARRLASRDPLAWLCAPAPPP